MSIGYVVCQKSGLCGISGSLFSPFGKLNDPQGELSACLAFLPGYYFINWHFLISAVLERVIGGSQISS